MWIQISGEGDIAGIGGCLDNEGGRLRVMWWYFVLLCALLEEVDE